jgi:outer membrane biosynthesis protein TonB
MAMSASAPMPAHFMNPQPPYSDGRVDPPGTAVTSRNRVVGRPAMSWAAALLAFGLLVGVGAVAVMQGSADGLVDTTASFVDPARAGQKPAAAAQPAPQPVPQPVATETPAPQPPPQAAPPPQPTVVAASTPPAPVADPPAKPDKPEKPAKPARRSFAASAPAAPRPAPAPAPAPAADDDTKTAAAAKPAKPAKATKGGGDDDETKKALEQLQKAQLESAQTF